MVQFVSKQEAIQALKLSGTTTSDAGNAGVNAGRNSADSGGSE